MKLKNREFKMSKPTLSLSELSKFNIILFGGKGGVGKTVCAVATGVYMAKNGNKTLVYSVDPAHSLSDCFIQKIGDKITHVDEVNNLYALEINPERLLEGLKKRYKDAIEEALDQVLKGFDLPFEREIMKNIMDLSSPGLDELMALAKLNDIIKSNEFDSIVIDTAAGAHTIRLLELPHIVEDWIQETLRLHDRCRYMMPLERCRSIIENLREDITALKENLTKRATFIPVTIPEAMGIYVTEDIVKGLKACRIPYKSIIINYVIPGGLECGYCNLRRRGQIKRIKEIYDKFPECNIVEAPLFPGQIIGIESIARFAKVLFEGRYEPNLQGIKLKIQKTFKVSFIKKTGLNFSKNLQLILFGGKGGCGKTTCSSATGIYMAKHNRKTLVISTDPQRSLSDSFDQTIGEDITPIKDVKDLYALEIDAEKLLQEFKKQHRDELLEIASTATYFEKEELARFFDLSLPGMDEVMALIKISDLMREGKYDLFILDTAPTGHTLRFLELPKLMSKWVKIMVKMRSKTQYIIQTFFRRGVREKADIFLEKMLNDIKRVRSALTNPNQTEFVLVTTLEEMAIKESKRFLITLNSYQIPIKQIIVNGLIPPNLDCVYCASKMEIQQKEFEKVRKEFSGLNLVQVQLFPHEVRGIADLANFADALFASA